MRFTVCMLVGFVASTLLAGCPPVPVAARPVKAGPPPFKVSFRKSQIPGQGLVANVNNKSSTEKLTVAVVFVLGKGEKEDRSYRLDRQLKPLDSISIGWQELGGWKLKHGDKLRIRSDEYKADLACDVAE
jgi:hypothetical protein